ncbi:MAG: uroporphyrinogen decarboxylase [Betaproteobacteria bacterium AqS2]|uniref:Uroporphyrinogen decarboxylase n=1 Tax=Candidatus Amphirhobacter heronislandensis TaxID=1732024 RepID=A0A930XY11_9GAMM|nr:uroporphyrinogen decarboxylase [Betaproteobacteria bacterium AqS2]
MSAAPTKPLLLRTLACEDTAGATPIWVMRQAGRYLPEYRELRQKAGSFLALCRDPALASEVTLQPIRRFGFDAAIIFSDILLVPDALGLELGFVDGEGPVLGRPLRTAAAVAALPSFDPARLAHLDEAIARTRAELPAATALIGFTGGAFTLACYMVDGRGGDFWQARRMLHAEPDLFQRIIDANATAIASSLAAQAAAGCDVLMVFDSWAGLAPRGREEELLLNPLRAVMAQLRAAGVAQPVIAFLRNASHLAAAAAATGVACLGVDWQSDLGALSRELGGRVALQGNLDPAVLLTDPATVAREAQRVLAAYAAPAGHVFNLGHGVDKETPVANMEALVAAVREGSGAARG